MDAAVNRIKQLGGAVYVPPTDVPNISRFSVVADPQMASLALVKGLKTGQAQSAAPGAPGRVGWHELLAADWEKAFPFYSDLFGWQKADSHFGVMGTYQGFAAGGETIGGMFTKPATLPLPFWLYYFNIDDVEAAANARGSRRRPNPVWPDCCAGRRLDRPLRRPPGRHIRAAGQARPESYRVYLFRARRTARPCRCAEPPTVLIGPLAKPRPRTSLRTSMISWA